MDNRAQVSFEYLTIIAILILMSALILVFSSLMFYSKEGVRNASVTYKEKLLQMFG